MKTQSDVAEITWKFRRFAKSPSIHLASPGATSARQPPRSIACVFIFVAEQTKPRCPEDKPGKILGFASSEIFAPHLLQMLDTNFTNSPQLVEGS
jgi:hypothetical protein